MGTRDSLPVLSIAHFNDFNMISSETTYFEEQRCVCQELFYFRKKYAATSFGWVTYTIQLDALRKWNALFAMITACKIARYSKYRSPQVTFTFVASKQGQSLNVETR